MRNLLHIFSFLFLTISAFCQIDTIELEFDEVRDLYELNKPNSGEGYPWISNDGLRLYYTTISQPYFVNVFAEREDIDDLFSDPVPLTVNSDSTNNLSPWLTDDELDIYFVSRVPDTDHHTKLYHATRDDIGDNFEAPTEVILNGVNNGFYSSPSFTEDLEQLFIYNAFGIDEDTIFYFKKTDDNVYDKVEGIPIPEGYIPGTGKLSKNGLRYYLSMGNTAGFDKKMYVAEREDLDSKFESLYFIDNDLLNSPGTQNIQPSFSVNRRFMVFTRGNGQSWGGNDMFIAYKEEPVSVDYIFTIAGMSVKISPNPASDFIKFEIENNNKIHKPIDLVIYSSDGRVVDMVMLENLNANLYLSTSKYSAGMYFFKMKCKNGNFASGSFTISK